MNPYAARARRVEDPARFYGRQAELRDLFGNIAARQSCSIVGPRRIGKSSLLCQLVHTSVQDQYLPATALGQRNAAAPPTPEMYSIAGIRNLLRQAFTDVDLRRFCQDRRFLQPVMNQAGSEAGLDSLIDEILTYCQKQLLFPELLAEVESYNPRQYERHRSQLVSGDQEAACDGRSTCVFALIDLQELAKLGPDDFFLTAAERLKQAAGKRLEIEPERDGTATGFRHFLRRATEGGWRLVLCCDEFEMLSQTPQFDNDFFTYLRGLCSNYNLVVVTSSRSSLFELCHQGNLQTSEFWNVFVERRLGLMLESEARSLIVQPFQEAGLPLRDQDVNAVLELAGCHPFFLQVACYHLFESRSGHPLDWEEVEQRFLREAQRHYTYAWERLTQAEQEALVAMTRQEESRPHPAILQALREQALVGGSPAAPTITSRGLRSHVERQAETKSAPGASATGVKPSPSPAPAPRERTLYADFDLKVEQLDATTCRVLVLDSPAGQDSAEITLPFSLEQVGDVMVDLSQQIHRGPEGSTATGVSAMTIGEGLFRAVFSGVVGQLFFESLGEVRSRQQGLRIKVHVDPEESPPLAALPWEYLYNHRRRRFISLDRLTPVIRYLDVQAPTARPQITPPLRVLVAIASPADQPPLDLATEKEGICSAWGQRHDVSVKFLEPATPEALQEQLWDWAPHVVHFMGHGWFDPQTGQGALLFLNSKGFSQPITGAQLGMSLRNAPSVRLAFLNACQSAQLTRSRDLDPFSGVAAALVIAGLPAVVAMQFPVTDRSALAFANAFYPRLASGEAVDVAVAFGREALALVSASSQEWGTPVLFMRIPDGLLFDID